MDYSDSYRRRPDLLAPGLVRINRAVDYIRDRLTRLVQQLEAMKTKGVGEFQFSIGRLASQLIQICSISGDPFLSDRIAYQISRLRYWNPRTPRADAIVAINEIIRGIERYEPLNRDSDDEELLAAQAGEKNGRKALPSDLAKEKSLFVIMPFSQDFNDVWIGGIQTAAKSSGFHPIRVDTIARSANITDDIVESIKSCRITIVDVTGNNPNVMFELGYVMALSKPYVIISQSVEFLPFDIRNIRTIVYSNTWSGIEELKGKLNEFLTEFSTHSKSTRSRKRAKT